jgi:hypothetical protein
MKDTKTDVWIYYSLSDFRWGELDETLFEIANLHDGRSTGGGTGFGERDQSYVFPTRARAEAFAGAVRDNWSKVRVEIHYDEVSR